eukprot:Skav210625  [mRNA]  locus=scaffold234:640337:644443:- [translate_table: standard]
MCPLRKPLLSRWLPDWLQSVDVQWRIVSTGLCVNFVGLLWFTSLGSNVPSHWECESQSQSLEDWGEAWNLVTSCGCGEPRFMLPNCGDQERSTGAIRGHQGPSGAIRGHQGPKLSFAETGRTPLMDLSLKQNGMMKPLLVLTG